MENKENIFAKFINFINRVFGKGESKKFSTKLEETKKQELKSNFFDELRVYKEEDFLLLKLQDKYEKKEIDLCDMSNEQIHALNLLYKRQVSELKKTLADRKIELNNIKSKIISYYTEYSKKKQD